MGQNDSHEDAAELRAVLLGSAAQPWPAPGCGCVACRAATAPGVHGPVLPALTGLEVPGVVRIDGPPGPGPSAGVRLVTRRRSGGDGAWPAPGERLELPGLRLAALPAADPDESVLVLGAAGRTVLWAPRPGPLPDATLEALSGGRLDAAVLSVATPPARSGQAGDAAVPSETAVPPGAALPVGARALPGSAPLGLAHELARLRAADALAPDAHLVAVGLSHDGPVRGRLTGSGAELALRDWEVETPPDGTVLRIWAGAAAGVTPARRQPVPHRTLVLGPAGSGKSELAEALLAAEPAVLYAATGPVPDGADTDWADRVRGHQARRPPWWHTREGNDLAAALAEPGPPVLVDSIGTWLAPALDRSGAWQDRPDWRAQLDAELDGLVRAWRGSARRLVAVGEEVGWGVVPQTRAGRLFRDLLGPLVQRLASESERVLLVVGGRILTC